MEGIAALVHAVQRGDREAFRQLYERFHRVVHAIALGHVAAGSSDDVVQDVFAEVWMKAKTVREPAAFPGWITTIARRRAIDHARKRGPIVEADDRAIAPAPNPEALAALHALRELPETYRETMIMRLVEGLTGPEIAERTGMTPDSVRVHLHRGMKLLREKLEAA